MTDTKYTPGPWRVEYSGGDTYVMSADGTSLMCDMTYYPWVPDNTADWHLIAAAPDLLALVELVYGSFVGGRVVTFSDGDIAAFASAIAKAKGETK